MLFSLLFLTSGTLHFLLTASFSKIVPPYIPYPQAAVYISGAAELAGAIGLQIPRLRRIAAWGLVALLVAVFPANIDMAANSIQLSARPIPSWILWARLPLQPVLIYWLIRSADLLPGRLSEPRR
ncbi:MAG TPA: DoxX family protein [Bryobacteraceae bacterium]|nr:DoxX family protein [Bryobacteraceae bacterium]